MELTKREEEIKLMEVNLRTLKMKWKKEKEREFKREWNY
jgi:hypothetical protein